MEWIYKGVPLKQYLYDVLNDKSELEYLYSTVRRLLAREYHDGVELDSLIDDIMKRDKIKKIIKGDYKKQEKTIWEYKKMPLKEYLRSIVSKESDLEYLYETVTNILRNEYTENKDLEKLIEDVINRDRVQNIIKGTYEKNTETSWFLDGMTLTDYIKTNLKSEYRSTKRIRQRIQDEVTERIKNENLGIESRERFIREYIETPDFKQFLTTPPKKKLDLTYEGKSMRKYLEGVVVDKDNFDYIYSYITSTILSIHKADSTRNVKNIIDEVMHREDIIKLINTENVQKIQKEVWLYGEGLLIDYLKNIDLNGKYLKTVYIHIKKMVLKRNPEGFKTTDERKKATEEYVASKDFLNYLKYGYTKKVYFYKGMLLIDYLKLNYAAILSEHYKTPDNMYLKVINVLSRYEGVRDLTIEETEQVIESVLKSDEIKEYLNKDHLERSIWDYEGRDLKEVIAEIFSSIIEEEMDIYRIYGSITLLARKMKKKNPERDSSEIIDSILNIEYIENFKTNYIRRKYIRKTVARNRELFENQEDEDYIKMYIKDNNLDDKAFAAIKSRGFSSYSAIILLEYANTYESNIEDLINYTLQDDGSNIHKLWLFKLGYQEKLFDVLNSNDGLVRIWIYEAIVKEFDEIPLINYEDLYSYIREILLKKHRAIVSPIEHLFRSFRLFIKGCTIRYIYDVVREKKKINDSLSIFDEYQARTLKEDTNIEDEYIQNEESKMIQSVIDELDLREQRFVDMRYGFTMIPHNLYEIKKSFEEEGIMVTIEELNDMESNILDKLRNNEIIKSLQKKNQGSQ